MNIEQILSSASITAVWTTLGGAEPKNGRAAAFYRGGNNQDTVSINEDKGVWYDHRDNAGGGILTLIQHVNACGKREAARWLSEFTGLPLDEKPFTPIQRDDYTRRKAEDQQIAQDATDFRNGLEIYLKERVEKYSRIVGYFLEHIDEDAEPAGSEELIEANKMLDTVRLATFNDVLRMYREASSPEKENFRKIGKLHRECAEEDTKSIVNILAYSSQ